MYDQTQFFLLLLCIRQSNIHIASEVRQRLSTITIQQCCGLDPNFSHPGSEFLPSRIRDTGRIRIKEFKYFNQKMVSKLSEIWSRLFIPYPDPDFLPILDPGFKGQKRPCTQGSKRHRIPDPDPQHCNSEPLRKKAQELLLGTPWWAPQSWSRWWRWDTPSWSAPCSATGRWTPRSRRRTPYDRCFPLQTSKWKKLTVWCFFLTVWYFF